MFRSLAIAALLAPLVLGGPAWAEGHQSEAQELVDRSTLAAQDMLNDHDGTDAQRVLRRARAVMICPRVFQAGFLLGGQGGGCVLAARDGAGSWSPPAFYGMGAGSIGFQAGIQDSEVMLMILTERGLRAIMDSQFKLGGEAGGTFVEWGGGIQGGTSAAFGADIVGFTRSRGLFAGISLSGSMLGARSEWNRDYYGREAGAQDITLAMSVNNPGANPLREILGRYGADPVAAPPALPGRVAYAPPAANFGKAEPAPAGRVTAMPLPPPSPPRRY